MRAYADQRVHHLLDWRLVVPWLKDAAVAKVERKGTCHPQADLNGPFEKLDYLSDCMIRKSPDGYRGKAIRKYGINLKDVPLRCNMVRWISLLLAFSIAAYPAVAAVPNPVLSRKMCQHTDSQSSTEEARDKGKTSGKEDARKILIFSAVMTGLGVFLLLNGDFKEERELIGEVSPWGGWLKNSDDRYDYIEMEWEGNTLKSYGVRYEADAFAAAGFVLTSFGLIGLLIGAIAYSAE